MLSFRFAYVMILTSLLLTGCKEKTTEMERGNNTTTFSGNAMMMQYKIIVGTTLSSNQSAEIHELLAKSFEEVNRTYNKWNPRSEIALLNRLPAYTETTISPELEKFLTETQQIVHISRGKFDPTIEPLQQLWKRKLEMGTVPSQQEIRQIAPAIGWHHIHFRNGKFYKDHPLTSIDLGGIAKGLCIDLITERLENLGYNNVYVEWGGEIRTLGEHPDGRPWRIYISRLGDNEPSHAIADFDLTNQAIATSGDYLQNWQVYQMENGRKTPVIYFHVFDPHTLYPLKATPNSIASVSVVANSCTVADGLATASLVFQTMEEARRWAEGVKAVYPHVEFWFVSRNSLSE